MVWLCIVIGVVVGAALWGFAGALTLGFLGWLVGLIFQSKRQPAAPAPAIASVGAPADVLERRLAALEARLARVERAALGEDFVAVRSEEPAAAPAPLASVVPAIAAAPVVPSEAVAAADAPAGAAPAPSAPPSKPNFIVPWLAGGHTIVPAGLVILLFGLPFLVQYTRQHHPL